MAPQRALKSLNKGPGNKRFVFKTFAQRVDEVDIDVFRSLAPVKFEPTSGSSFFHENLLRWRELNVAADFIAVYVELLPLVQTLPQLLLHKDQIIRSLLSRVKFEALLSLEPILSLIALLSRDLQDDFLPYISQFMEACSDLLKAGGDQEPELIEQVFVSISYVIKYLTKFLAKDILFVLRVTKSLRTYLRTFVQDFVAESISYLFHKAPAKQLIKGVRRLFAEVEADSSETKISSCCTILFHTLKGPAVGLHSQAETLLHLLLDKTTLSGTRRKKVGDSGEIAVQVVSKTFWMLCDSIKREKLEPLWVCIVDHISSELDSIRKQVPRSDSEVPTEDIQIYELQDEFLATGHVLGSDAQRERTLDNMNIEQPGPRESIQFTEEIVLEDVSGSGHYLKSDGRREGVTHVIYDVQEPGPEAPIESAQRHIHEDVSKDSGLQLRSDSSKEGILHLREDTQQPAVGTTADERPVLRDEVSANGVDLASDHRRETIVHNQDVPKPDAKARVVVSEGHVLQVDIPATGQDLRQTISREEIVLTVLDKTPSYPSIPGSPNKEPRKSVEPTNALEAESGNIQLVHLVSLLVDVLEFRKGSRVNDYRPLFALVPRLLAPEMMTAERANGACRISCPLAPLRSFEDWTSRFLVQVFRFLLALVRSHTKIAGASAGPISIATSAPTWAVAFKCDRVNCLFPFLRGLLGEDATMVRIFVPEILRAMERLVEDYLVDVLPLLLDLVEKMSLLAIQVDKADIGRLKTYVIHVIEESMKGFQRGSTLQSSSVENDYIETLAMDPAMVWVALRCLPYIAAVGKEQGSLAWDYAHAVKHFLSSPEKLAAAEMRGNSPKVWECLLASALSSHTKILKRANQQLTGQHVDEYLNMATIHKRSSHVLDAVGEGLGTSGIGTSVKDASTRLRALLDDFVPNLSASNKTLRLATLRIISFYELLPRSEQDDQSSSKRRKGNNGEVSKEERPIFCECFQHLLAVESSLHKHENFRQSSLLITALKVSACTRKIPEYYVVPLVHALIGLLHNRFSLMWDPVMEALAAMVEAYGDTVGQVLVSHFARTQNMFLFEEISDRKDEGTEDLDLAPTDLWDRFHSYVDDEMDGTQIATLLTLKLRTLQKVANFAEARSRQLIPLFLEFAGHSESPEGSQGSVVGGGKEWKAVLKEWLTLIKGMRNARSLFRGSVVKEILLKRFLSDRDPAVQLVTFEALLNWKEKYFTNYEERLRNLISSKAIREELTTWDVSKDSHLIQDEDREPLLTVTLLILFPKIMRRTVKSMGKSGAGVQRNAVLSFLARLESEELAPLFIQLIKPLGTVFKGSPAPNLDGVLKAGWMSEIEKGAGPQFIEQVDTAAVAALPYKRKLGYLHVVMDSLDIFNGTQLTPYLYALLAVVLRLLETCLPTLQGSCDEKISDHDRALEGKTISLLEAEKRMSTALGHADINGSGEGSSAMFCRDSEIRMGTQQGVDSLQFHEMQSDREAQSIGEDERGSLGIAIRSDEEKGRPQVSTGESLSLTKELGQVEPKLEEDGNFSEHDKVTVPKIKGGGVREIRTLCFKILATVIRNFEDTEFPTLYWDIFFRSVQLSVGRFASENSFVSSPGPLLQCFMAMSRRPELAPLLARDTSLVPNVLSILGTKDASSEVVSAVLTLIENILDLVNRGDGDETVGPLRAVLLPHLDSLLENFRQCLSFHRQTAQEKRSLKRELRILTLISKHIGDNKGAAKLQDVLLPMLKVKRRMDSELFVEVLRLVQAIGPMLQPESVTRCLPFLASLLVTVSVRDVRLAVSDTLIALARVDPALLGVAELIGDLNSMSATTVDEFDYGRRLLAYDRMTAEQFAQLTRAQAIVLLSHIIYDMGSDDMSIRHRSSDCLQTFVRFASTLQEDDEEPHAVTDESASLSQIHDDHSMDAGLNGAATGEHERLVKSGRTSFKNLVPSFLLSHLRIGIASDILVQRREWVLLLREMSTNFSRSAALKEFQCLISDDVEADFFHNIVHLQIHRRIKAMAKFKGFCMRSHFSQGALSRIFVPLFMNSLFEARGDKEGNLVTASVEALACIAAQFQWEPYFGLLMHCFRLLTSKSDHQKVLVRMICAILDAFHFFVPLDGKKSGKGQEEISGEARLLQSVDDSQAQQPKDDAVALQLLPEVLSLLQRRVLPEIKQLMVSKEGMVSTPVALAQVKILKLMPEPIVEIELPQVIRTIINALKSRSQGVRDEGRVALVAITETLGPNYVHFVVDVLKSSLTRGFELHVLGYTLNTILVKLVPTLKVGEIDYCLKSLLEVVENDIIGEVAEEKDVEAIAVKMKETKHMRSFESMKLLAQVVTFRTQAVALLGPVRRNLPNSLAPKMKSKLEKILQHIALGLLHNESVTYSDLFVVVYAMVEDGIKEEKDAALAAAAKKQARVEKSMVVDNHALPSRVFVPHTHLITEYALQLFNSNLRRMKVSPHDKDLLGMLNPFVDLLQECLNSKYDGVLALALKNFSLLLLLPLPAIDVHGNKITALVFSISQRYAKAENPLLQACLGVLVILIRRCKTLRLSDDQLRSLIQLPVFVDLEGGSRTALSLLKAIVSRKLLVPELYDMMNRLAQLMVTSYAAPVRQICSQILLQFLLDYPLGKKRLQQHLDFFIANVGYTESSGREAALEMLHAVISKFPDVVVQEHADSIFFPLVTRLVNDDSNQVRSMIGTILKVLMECVGPQSLQRMTEFAVSWYNGTDPRLRRTAAQVLGFVIEVMKASSERYVQDLLPKCMQILEEAKLSHVDGLAERETEDSWLWQNAYFSLTMMEKLLVQSPHMILLSTMKPFWTTVSTLLLHPHLWVRKVCGRLLSMYFTTSGQPNRQRLEAAVIGKVDVLFLHPSWVLLLAASFCQQLDSTAIDDDMADQLVKMLEMTAVLLPVFPQSDARTSADPQELSFLGCDDEESSERVSRGLRLLQGNRRSEIDDKRSDRHTGVEAETGPGLAEYSVNGAGSQSSWALSLVFHKLQKIALRVHPIQTKVVLRWYAAMGTRLGAIDIEHYLRSMLTVLIKLTEGSAAKVVPEDVKGLGVEVLNQLRELVGTAKFVNMYSAVRERQKENREKRKQAQKISVLVDPERNAKRKIKMTAKRQDQKRRKIIRRKAEMGL